MGSTTPYGLRYPEYATGADPKRDIQYLAEDVAPKLYRAEPLTGTQIAAISSPRIGQLAMNTDTGRVLYWTGGMWRPVGGGASGTVAIGAINLTTTYQTFSYFIGLGFEEVQFALTVGSGSAPFGAVITAVSDPTRAIGTVYNYAAAAFQSGVFAPVAATDVGTITLGGTSNSASIRNVRLESDGYLRFELAANPAFTTAAGLHFNWRAR